MVACHATAWHGLGDLITHCPGQVVALLG
jgi:hypothetical protein